MGKKLVAYFSASANGVTRELSKEIAKITDADLYEIKPETLYTEADLDWKDKEARCWQERNDIAFRPPIADKNANIADYDVIFIGFPIWWHIAPPIINTFLESYDFSGKTIVSFATSGSDPFGESVAELKPSAPAAIFKDGILLKSRTVNENLAEWLDSLGL